MSVGRAGSASRARRSSRAVAAVAAGGEHEMWMRRALALAKRAAGKTAPNPMVGAVLVRRGQVLGQGWHHRAGLPHAEIEALRDAQRKGHDIRGATLYVTLEPCSTTGRTPPCTEAVLAAGLARVVVAAVDPNPRHAGRGLEILRRAGVEVVTGVGAVESERLNEAFNHWITTGLPWVVVKAAMTIDGKIATRGGESKWITGPASRAEGMRWRRVSGAMVVGVETVLQDDPSLTVRTGATARVAAAGPWRVILDSRARTPLTAAVVTDAWRERTRIVVGARAPQRRVAALRRLVEVWTAPSSEEGRIDVRWLLRELGDRGVVQVLVEGGGEVQASFLLGRLAQRVLFFYAPLVVGGDRARRAVAGLGAAERRELVGLTELRWRRLGPDLMLTARIGG